MIISYNTCTDIYYYGPIITIFDAGYSKYANAPSSENIYIDTSTICTYPNPSIIDELFHNDPFVIVSSVFI